MDVQAIFGGPLQPDPAIALPDYSVEFPPDGPAHQAQYVVELVGERTVPISSAQALLDPRLQGPLGTPEVWVMRPSDSTWVRLSSSLSGSVDSVALSWHFESADGSLSVASASHLLQIAEQFAAGIGRRAMAMPVPEDVPKALKRLDAARRSLDIGFELFCVGKTWIPEADIWRVCAGLGMDLRDGLFRWPANGASLVTVAPIGDIESFSLQAVEAGAVHEGVSIGFSVPTSAAPRVAQDACFRIADAFETKLGTTNSTDDDQSLTLPVRARAKTQLESAISALTDAGFAPGSRAARLTFG